MNPAVTAAAYRTRMGDTYACVQSVSPALAPGNSRLVGPPPLFPAQ